MILIIDNYDSFTYNLYQAVAKFTTNIRVIRNDRISIEAIQTMQPTGIILSPGPGRPEQAGSCVELVKKLGSYIPILGVCLGHQAIVIAFDGHVVLAPEIVHGKPEQIFHNQKDIYQRLPTPFQAGRYHSLVAERCTLPKELQIVAQNKSGLIMGIRHISYPIFGLQFHPESILTPHGEYFLQDFIGLCGERHYVAA